MARVCDNAEGQRLLVVQVIGIIVNTGLMYMHVTSSRVSLNGEEKAIAGMDPDVAASCYLVKSRSLHPFPKLDIGGWGQLATLVEWRVNQWVFNICWDR